MKLSITTTIRSIPFFLFIFCFLTNVNAQNIAVEQDRACINCPDLTADPSAALEVRASDKGVLVPRVANTSAISNPSEGLVIYDNSANDFKFYDGTKWQSMGLKHISFPINNAFVGINAGASITTGQENTAHGFEALYSNTTTYFNTAIGSRALYSNMGNANTAVGSSTLKGNTSGFHNTAIGLAALFSNTTGIGNTATGLYALYSNTTGLYSTATGIEAMYSNTTGGGTATGYKALQQNTTGSGNTATGSTALLSNTIGNNNTANGHAALLSSTTGNNNVASGFNSLAFSTTGDDNTAIGVGAMYRNTSGHSNTAVGRAAFSADSTFSNSTAIGYFAQPAGSNQVRLGNGSVTQIGGYANWSNVSDARFKKQVKNDVPGLAFISLLSPVTYQMDMDAIAKHHGTPDDLRLSDSERAKAAIRYTGFLAQDVEKAAATVGYDFSGVDAPQHERDNYNLRYAEFVVPLVKAVQELNEENGKLMKSNERLEIANDEKDKKISALEARLSKIETMLNKEIVSRDED